MVVFSQEEAKGLNHHYIGTEHLLLGLLREGEGLAARTLTESYGLSADAVRDDIRKIVGVGETKPEGQIPMTPRAKRVLELSLREALSLGHNYIGTEHLLLGLLREHDGVGMRILTDHELDGEQIRNEVVRRFTPREQERTRPTREDWLLYGLERIGSGGTGRHAGTHDLRTEGSPGDGEAEVGKKDELLRKAQEQLTKLEGELEALSALRSAPRAWIVQRYDGARREDPQALKWVDIPGPVNRGNPFGTRPWHAKSAGDAFRLAVLDNPTEKIESTSYRILAYDGGVTFNVGINLDAESHERKGE